ncbi:response regulator transcription factor [Spiractinospora alimapuensis]|uniref:response regulator n=1 Tax=Spiractinospora alimapuensis TaxID=2820884 RepID=UPI001F2EBD81|nr:response regulator transcription factor [Spiractinospora alimapuensis]QVQ54732.1 response regulator transcription factor [Spiractinospora alimapuensis]
MIRVVLADDEAMMRAGVRALVTADGDVAVVGEAADGRVAVGLVAEHSPDVVLLDIRMPGTDGLTAAAELRRDFPDTAVVMLTLFGEESYIASALDHGVSGFVLKTGDPFELLAGLRAAAEGAVFLSPPVARWVIDQLGGSHAGRAAEARDRVASLSAREREVLSLVAAGMTNREIARHLALADSTVKTHLDSIRLRLGTTNRVQAAVLAYEAGIVGSDDG